MEVNFTSKICNRNSKNLGRFDLEGLRQLRRLKMRVKSSPIITYLVETDDVMTESESGGKLVNKLVRRAGNSYGGRDGAVTLINSILSNSHI